MKKLLSKLIGDEKFNSQNTNSQSIKKTEVIKSPEPSSKQVQEHGGVKKIDSLKVEPKIKTEISNIETKPTLANVAALDKKVAASKMKIAITSGEQDKLYIEQQEKLAQPTQPLLQQSANTNSKNQINQTIQLSMSTKKGPENCMKKGPLGKNFLFHICLQINVIFN